MTARPLDFDFTPMSDLSHRPPHAVPLEEQERELADEMGRRRDRYPMLVTQARLQQDDADRHLLLWEEILADCRCHPFARSDADRFAREIERRDERLASGIIWEDKVRELRREIAMRRNSYPKQIESHRLTVVDARHRLEVLEAAHWRYWMGGWTWHDRLVDLPGAETRERIRAFEAPRMAYELAAIAAGERWAPPVYDRATWNGSWAAGRISPATSGVLAVGYFADTIEEMTDRVRAWRADQERPRDLDNAA